MCRHRTMALSPASIACTSTDSHERQVPRSTREPASKFSRRSAIASRRAEPLYRIYAFDHSEYDLAVAATKMDTGYVIDGRRSPSRRQHHEIGRPSLPALRARDASRLASRLGVPMHEIRGIHFPTANCV